jgi:hypothetical protein
MMENCRCRVCLRQPPSLKGTALNFIINFFFHLRSFQLTADINYQQYVFAANRTSLRYWGLPRVPYHRLVPKSDHEISWDFKVRSEFPVTIFRSAYCPNLEKVLLNLNLFQIKRNSVLGLRL